MNTEKIIVYEDDNLIICNKPVGMASQSGRGFEQDLLSNMHNYRAEKGEAVYAAIINRLDKPVGGLVLFAKDKKTAARLSALSGEHSIEKKYYALVKGRTPKKGQFEDYLLKTSANNVSKIVSEDMPGAKRAKLLFNTLWQKIVDGEEYSLVEVRLLTGRHHQIRVQFSGHGYPLYGDTKYNPDFSKKRGIYPALFAYHLSFKNPVGIDTITVATEPENGIFKL